MVDIGIFGKIHAIIRLRITLVSRGMRLEQGVSGFVSAVILLVVGSIMSIGAAVLFAVLVHGSVDSGDLVTLHFNLKVAFYVFFILGVVLPIAFQQMQIGIDTTRFRIYPISRAWLYAITIGSGFGSPDHIFYYPALAAIYVTGVLSAGRGALLGTVVIPLLVLFYVALGNTIALIAQAVMRKRRGRELFTVLIISILTVIWFGFFASDRGWIRSLGPVAPLIDNIRGLSALQRYLPPKIAADAITSLHRGATVPALLGALHLGLWITAVTVMGYFVFSRLLGGERMGRPGVAPTPTPEAKHRTALIDVHDMTALLRLPVETYAMVAKELRYIVRSAIGRGMIILVPCITVVHSLLIKETIKSAAMDIQPAELGLYVVPVYIAIVMGNYICNSFQWDGGGIQVYFMSPAPLAPIVAGKNLGIAVYATLLFCVSAFMYGVITDTLDLLTFAMGFLVFANSILTILIAGNYLAIKYPIPNDASRMRWSLSQSAQLFLFLVIFMILIYLAVFMTVPYLLSVSVLRLPLLIVLLALQAGMYGVALRSAARRMNDGREILMSRILKSSQSL